MVQINFNTGSTLNVADALANLGFLGTFTQVLPSDEIRVLVDTSVARTVVLPYSVNFPVKNVKITVIDITGNAGSNNITVGVSSDTPNDAINGLASLTMSVNYAAYRFEVLNTNQYFAVNLSAGGSGLLSFDFTFTPSQILSILNDNTQFLQLVAPVNANQVLQVFYASMIPLAGTTNYNGAAPTLSIKGAQTPAISSWGIIPYGILTALTPNVAEGFVPQILGSNRGNISTLTVGGGLYLGSDGNNQSATQGDYPIRVYGSYTIKNLS